MFIWSALDGVCFIDDVFKPGVTYRVMTEDFTLSNDAKSPEGAGRVLGRQMVVNLYQGWG